MTFDMDNLHSSLRRGWHVLCRSNELTRQPAVFSLLNASYVAYRGPTGRVVVARDRCPHRRARLSLGSCDPEGSLQCPYHGWRFNQLGEGIEIPALPEGSPLPPRAHLELPAAVEERFGMVFIALESPSAPLPTVAEDELLTFERGDLPVLTTRGSAGLLADNFLDVAHFPFVHSATFGAEAEVMVPSFEVIREDLSFTARHEHWFSNREDPGVVEGIRPLLQRRALTYRYTAPFHLTLTIDFLDAGGTNVIGFFLTPEDATTVRIYSSLWRNDLEGSKARMDEAIALSWGSEVPETI
ncbi:MAG: Rieske 2Fe-2S domain-containing protein, partial [Actinomycetota bacterium]